MIRLIIQYFCLLGVVLTLFGSSRNGFAFQGSDMDVSMTHPYQVRRTIVWGFLLETLLHVCSLWKLNGSWAIWQWGCGINLVRSITTLTISWFLTSKLFYFARRLQQCSSCSIRQGSHCEICPRQEVSVPFIFIVNRMHTNLFTWLYFSGMEGDVSVGNILVWYQSHYKLQSLAIVYL